MKYQEINLNRQLLGPNYMIYDWKESPDEITIFSKSQTDCAICPRCGTKSTTRHATYRRRIQMVPIRLKNTFVDLNAFKFDCENKNCSRKVFMEQLDFASFYQTKSDELFSLIFATALFLSNEGASKVLKLMGINISNDSIKRIYDKLEIEDNPNVEEIGIDDVAIRKGQTYATAIYDAKSRQLMALLDGRDAETVKKWLKGHTKIKIASRDRASAYASAITEVLPECIQVADRFHLIQNLIDKMKEIFKEELPAEIFIKDGKIIDAPVKKEEVLKVPLDSPLLKELSYDNTAPVDEDGRIIKFDNKNRQLQSEQYRQHAENRKKNNSL